jgi:16S rRNA (cytosine1402-N4)-methyltransferase
MTTQPPHISILVNEIIDLLHIPDCERVIDGTLGAGGHTQAFLDAGAREVLGLDVDPQALSIARARLAPYQGRAHIAQASYVQMGEQAAALRWDSVDAILLDLGASSMQFDTPERGFSFRHDAPLDMRFDPSSERPTAADLVNTLAENELADLFFRYGEDPQARRLARAVVQQRPYATTGQLAAVIEQTARRPKHKHSIHPATLIFQALRIAVNGELDAVERALPLAIDLLRSGGRLGVISFHSLEDRIVKDSFKLESTDCICPPKIPVCVCGHKARVALVTRKPLTASDAEIATNPRSRSAKLRVVEKLAT